MDSATFCIFILFYLFPARCSQKKEKRQNAIHAISTVFQGQKKKKKIARCSSRICGFGCIPLFLMFDHLFTSLWFDCTCTELLHLPSNSKPTGQARYNSLVTTFAEWTLLNCFRMQSSTLTRGFLCFLK